MNTMKYFLRLPLRLIQKLLDAGSLIMVVSILLLASAALLLVVALICLSLMIRIVSRTLFPRTFWTSIMNGIRRVLGNVYNRVARLF
jgi:cell shape-determining protein MreC